MAARTLDAVAGVAPVLAAAAVAGAAASLWAAPEGGFGTGSWWAALLAAAGCTLAGTWRSMSRLRRLATLHRWALAFPGPTPSRWRLSGRPSPAEPTGPGAATATLVQHVLAAEHERRHGGRRAARIAAYADLIAVDLGVAPADRERLRWAALLHGVDPDERLMAPLRAWLWPWPGELTAGILGVATAYDAMTAPSRRDRPLTDVEAGAELLRNRGTRFDPDAVRALLHVAAERRRAVAGPLARLARVPAIRVLNAGADRPLLPRPALPALAGLATAAFVAATFAGGLAPTVGSGGDAAQAAPGSPTTRATPSPAPTDGSVPADPPTTPAGPVAPPGTSMPGTSEAAPGTSTTTGTTGPPSTTSTTGTPAPTSPPVPPQTTGTTTTTTTTGNAPPVAAADSLSVAILSTTTIDVLANDTDDTGLDPASLRITSLPGAGSASVEDGRIRYTAPLVGSTAEVGYRICDAHGECATAIVTIDIRTL